MKAIKIIQLLNNGPVIYQENEHKNSKQGVFEGFNISTTMISRYYFSMILAQSLEECTFSNKSNRIRYHNFEKVKQLVAHGVFKIKEQQFNESKIFNQEEKQEIKKISEGIQEDQIKEDQNSKIIDIVSDRKLIIKHYQLIKKHVEEHEVEIQCLAKQIVLKFKCSELVYYVPIKLRSIDHYFQLQQPRQLSQFLQKNKKLSQIKIFRPYLNLISNFHECQAQLSADIEQFILKKGWGIVNLKNLNRINIKNLRKYRELQSQARSTHVGIFKKPFEIMSLVYSKNNLVGVVQEVLEGYIFLIRTKNDEVKKVQLANISCPTQAQLGAFQCRQFARKNLINKEVNIFIKKDTGLVCQASIIRFADNKDVEILMIENGYGLVKEELKESMICMKISALENKMRQKKKGIHNPQKLGVYHYEDLTVQHHKKQKLIKQTLVDRKLHYLQQIQSGVEAVIEKIQDMLTYIVRIDQDKKIIRIRLDGVSTIQASPKLPEIIEINKNASEFINRNLKQRTITIEVTDLELQSNYYSGIIRIRHKGKNTTIQELLLAEGFVHCEGIFSDEWLQVEQQAKKKQKHIWGEKIKQLNRPNLLQDQPHQFVGKFSWAQNGELAYIQPSSINDKLDYVYDKLNHKDKALQPIQKENVVVGYLCAAQFMGEFCRCRIVSITDYVAINFIDWGNKDTVSANHLFQIPSILQYMPPLCCEVRLDLVQPLKLAKINKQHLEKVREAFMENQQIKVVKNYSNIVNIFTNGGKDHLNINLIQQGLLKAELSKVSDQSFRNHLHEIMEKLRIQLVGIWQDEEEEKINYDKYIDYDEY